MPGYNFTEHLRTVLAMAREEAATLHYDELGTEHLLLGLTREGQGIAIGVMESFSVSPARIRDTVLGMLPPRRGLSDRADISYTSRAKKVLELAMAEARALEHDYIGTEHLLLGLLAEQKGVAARVLVDAGLTLDGARHATLRLLGDAPAATRGGASADVRRPRRRSDLSAIVMELRFEDGSTKRHECRTRFEAMRFLMQA
jgi:ATP-dependent Clp protease ATP-binding subunit ClpC